ncbi:hypothetical protein CEUSTIGMA_g6723.t1 [Chlamydomonas eustigma]|uniref:Phosphate transporter n=1 Tax=Chlamydomonas eustigma TaxID=1157962 RepID=A0A250X881_9CHLO|nr:hypothetical protein CEUSTIGMA_g6723.t1 [Chlamydomonas eustigma]|eukprot:GAX79283.1 hypothetical protein CEUSTIGMA_g6723.t1 [Chlamydomonas eustigma]
MYMYGMLCSLTAAGMWVTLACYLSVAVSSTQAIIGAIVGFGLVYSGGGGVNWFAQTAVFPYLFTGMVPVIASWFIAPFLAAVIAAVIFLINRALILRSERSTQLAMWSLPVLVLFTMFINIFFILIQVLPKGVAESTSAWIAAAAAGVTGILAALGLVPAINYRLKQVINRNLASKRKDDLELKPIASTLVVGTTGQVASCHEHCVLMRGIKVTRHDMAACSAGSCILPELPAGHNIHCKEYIAAADHHDHRGDAEACHLEHHGEITSKLSALALTVFSSSKLLAYDRAIGSSQRRAPEGGTSQDPPSVHASSRGEIEEGEAKEPCVVHKHDGDPEMRHIDSPRSAGINYLQQTLPAATIELSPEVSISVAGVQAQYEHSIRTAPVQQQQHCIAHLGEDRQHVVKDDNESSSVCRSSSSIKGCFDEATDPTTTPLSFSSIKGCCDEPADPTTPTPLSSSVCRSSSSIKGCCDEPADPTIPPLSSCQKCQVQAVCYSQATIPAEPNASSSFLMATENEKSLLAHMAMIRSGSRTKDGTILQDIVAGGQPNEALERGLSSAGQPNGALERGLSSAGQLNGALERGLSSAGQPNGALERGLSCAGGMSAAQISVPPFNKDVSAVTVVGMWENNAAAAVVATAAASEQPEPQSAGTHHHGGGSPGFSLTLTGATAMGRVIGSGFRGVQAAVLHGVTKDIHQDVEGTSRSIEMHQAAEIFDPKTEVIYKYLQVFSACSVAFAHGANDVANAVGPFAVIWYIYRTWSMPQVDTPCPYWMLAMGGAGMVVGLWTYGYNIMRAVGVQMIKVTPSRGFCAELSVAIVVTGATSLGYPVSTSQCLIGAEIGVGLCERSRGRSVNWRLFLKMLISWCVTMLVTATLCAFFFSQGVYAPSIIMSREVNEYQNALQLITESNLQILNQSNYNTLSVTGRYDNLLALEIGIILEYVKKITSYAVDGYCHSSEMLSALNSSQNMYQEHSLVAVGYNVKAAAYTASQVQAVAVNNTAGAEYTASQVLNPKP